MESVSKLGGIVISRRRFLPCIFITGLVFCYFFQVPFKFLSAFIAPSAGLFCLSVLYFYADEVRVERYWVILYLFFVLFLILSSLFSCLNNTEINGVIRFFLIVSFLPLFSLLRINDFKIEFDIITLLAVLKCVYLLYISMRLIISPGLVFDYITWAQENQFGSINLIDGILPRIQIVGNALLPVILFLNVYRSSRLYCVEAILILGVVIAGNLAFYLGTAIFYFYRFLEYMADRNNRTSRKIVLSIICLLMFIPLLNYAVYQIKLKTGEDGLRSTPIKMEQARMLTNDVGFVGNGVGAEMTAIGRERNYSKRKYSYFELQTLYIFYQIGYVGLLWYYFLVFYQMRKNGRESVVLYVIYLLYSFWNPYSFDTTEMLALFMFTNLDRLAIGTSVTISGVNRGFGDKSG